MRVDNSVVLVLKSSGANPFSYREWTATFYRNLKSEIEFEPTVIIYHVKRFSRHRFARNALVVFLIDLHWQSQTTKARGNMCLSASLPLHNISKENNRPNFNALSCRCIFSCCRIFKCRMSHKSRPTVFFRIKSLE